MRCYDAIMLNKRFSLRSNVEIQMAQKLVANEKMVKMSELFETKFTLFHKNALITLQIKLRQKRGAQCPFPGYATAYHYEPLWNFF